MTFSLLVKDYCIEQPIFATVHETLSSLTYTIQQNFICPPPDVISLPAHEVSGGRSGLYLGDTSEMTQKEKIPLLFLWGTSKGCFDIALFVSS